MAALAEHRAFLLDILSRQAERRSLVDPADTRQNLAPQPTLRDYVPSTSSSKYQNSQSITSTPGAGPSKSNVVNYVAEEETIRNDLPGWYGASGELGSNYVLGAKDEEICEEYPALKKLMNLKKTHVESHSHPPLYLPLSPPALTSFTTASSPAQFDVILIHPLSSWEATAALPIRQISGDPSFVFLWVGKSDNEGLERGRECFAKWGFRRAEDIVWVKTSRNKRNHGNLGLTRQTGALFASQKEHCLMGIRGTVRRSTDMRFVHCNVDTDVIVWEEDEDEDEDDKQNDPANDLPPRRRPSPHLPPYLYTLIENFCLGTRRLELFSPSPQTSLRKGWVTSSLHPLPDQVSPLGLASEDNEEVQRYDPATYGSLVPQSDGRPILPYSSEIDTLRPKSPQRRPRNLPPTGSGTGSSSGLTPTHTGGGRPGSAASHAGGFRHNAHQNRNQGQNQMQMQIQPGFQQQPQISGQFQAHGGQQVFNPMFGGQSQGQMPMGGGYQMDMGMGGTGMGLGMNPAMGMGMGMGGMDMGMGIGMMNPIMMSMPQMGMSMGMPQMGMGMGIGMPGGMGGMNQNQFGQSGFNPGMGSGMGMGMGVNGGQPGFGVDGTGFMNPSQNQGGQGGMGWQGGGSWQ
ncbi:hypothetical protein I317_06399 [Kwoniella heveanensis CBS 569]|nr:hypothetical protein I317_06399 [Kwoniella heveanensis CBS 569]